MRTSGDLAIAAGFATRTGPRSDNQDFGGIVQASATERASHGVIAAIADGVSGGNAGRMASELTVRTLIDGYYASPPTLGPAQAMARPLAAFNDWLHGQARGNPARASATTLTALALHGRRAHVVHVGDTRAWRFAEGRLTCLTQDHVRPEIDMSHVLIRAIGLESDLRLDHGAFELTEQDRLVLTTDGVHAPLGARKIAAILAQNASAEATAELLVEKALEAGGADNATALVIDVVRLPAPDHDGILAAMSALPFITPPVPGGTLDGFAVERVLSEGRHAVLLVATDSENGEEVVLKFPRREILSERALRLAFAREMLLAQRVSSPFLLSARPQRDTRQSGLYLVQPFLKGETMESRLARRLPSLDAAREAAVSLTRAVAALHRLDVVHRDIKPDNVMLTEDGGLRLIDLGVARLPRVEDFPDNEIPGTPGYMAPEQFAGNGGDALTDQFALGVTLYRWFTGKWPYGEQEAFQRPRFGEARAPSAHRPEIPSWLDEAILRAIAVRREDRHGDVVELLRALEGGMIGTQRTMAGRPLMERNPVLFWKMVSLLLGAALIASLVQHRL
ncbi:protein serine/threonine phosphatase [Novosphingobium nitrogenifigens DSM 19370]|uniref:Protein serine/threonine phosphatase n=1 Tax=Novosphingobium nitrogenifigens DSM 19370 TaxID=983920 RepID=F1Z356_9SPHN|nr:bifunctional protein-serine/threonine kinase/phosphatase [Novosphingobium nitrogenifigens]EGD60957.1 protein serine/threonine phosphatase [Novosphingobium nitrogenifigens DSM 19370]